MNAGLARLLMTTQENGNLFGAQDALDTKWLGIAYRSIGNCHPSTQKHPNHKSINWQC